MGCCPTLPSMSVERRRGRSPIDTIPRVACINGAVNWPLAGHPESAIPATTNASPNHRNDLGGRSSQKQILAIRGIA